MQMLKSKYYDQIISACDVESRVKFLLSDRLIMKQTQSDWGQVILEVLHPHSSSSFNTDTNFIPVLSVQLRLLSLIAQRCPRPFVP